MTAAPAHIGPIASFPPHFFLENLAVRADGSILVTVLNHKQLWYVPAPDGGRPVTPVLVHTFDGCAMGIVETEPAAGFGGIGNGRLLIPQSVAETLRAAQANDLRDVLRGASNSKSTYASLTVRASAASKVASIEKSIKDMGFAAFSLLDATKNLTLIFTIFDSLLAIFGSLALAVATLGIVNTLVMAILERRREIGVLKALGAADRDVKRLFFAEAGVMGLLGGIVGVVFGWMIGRAVTIGTNIYLKQQNLPTTDIFSVPWWLAILAIVFAVIVSLVAGLYPASRAARLNPVEALRYE